MIKNSLYELKRTKEIILVLAKYGFGEFLEAIGFKVPYKKRVNLSKHERIIKAIEELGPTFIKMAQILSLRIDLIPLELAKEFEKLQDNVTPLPFEEIEIVLKEDLKNYSHFSDFELIASASIGQVYKAKLFDKEVAIKVLKPNIEEKIYADIAILMRLAKLLRERFLIYGVDLVEIVEEFANTIKKELDFNLEILNIKRFSVNFQNNPNIKVPKVYDEYSTKRVLVMEYIKGTKISDIKSLKEKNLDLKLITKKGFDLICEQIFIHRFFHADPHPGNLMVTDDGKIVFLDFGIMGRISEEDRRYFVDMIYYVVSNQEEKAALYILKLSKIKENIDISSFQKEMADIISTYFYASLKQVELKKLVDDMIKVMSKYKIYFKENNYLLLKSLVTIEGIGKKLYPQFNASKEIAPFIVKLYKEINSPLTIFKSYFEFNKGITNLLTNAPNDIYEILSKIKSGNLKIEFEHIGLDRLEKSIKSSFNKLSISILVASILIGSSMLLSDQIPPTIKGISIFGIVGYIFATIIGVALIISILRRK